jgi:hypothetical protein
MKFEVDIEVQTSLQAYIPKTSNSTFHSRELVYKLTSTSIVMPCLRHVKGRRRMRRRESTVCINGGGPALKSGRKDDPQKSDPRESDRQE